VVNDEEHDGRIEMTIVGGFLGAGKSTWLQHQLHVGHFGKVHVLVNEAAEVPVDHLFLEKAETLTILPDGCCCCEGAPQLIRSLRNICESHDNSTALELPRLLLETSGLADPAKIVENIQNDPLLGRRVRVKDTILIVDAGNLKHQLLSMDLVVRQIQSATILVISKVDTESADVVDRAANTLRLFNPSATLVLSDHGTERPADIAVDSSVFEVPSNLLPSDLPRAVSIELNESISWGALSVWLSAFLFAHRDKILRVKGVVSSPAGKLVIQSVRHKINAPQILPYNHSSGCALVIIGQDLDDAKLQESLRYWLN
jgi:G3E family GTPase